MAKVTSLGPDVHSKVLSINLPNCVDFFDVVTDKNRHIQTDRHTDARVQQRAPPIFGRAAITLGIVPHF